MGEEDAPSWREIGSRGPEEEALDVRVLDVTRIEAGNHRSPLALQQRPQQAS
jgi:hypothetical protein